MIPYIKIVTHLPPVFMIKERLYYGILKCHVSPFPSSLFSQCPSCFESLSYHPRWVMVLQVRHPAANITFGSIITLPPSTLVHCPLCSASNITVGSWYLAFLIPPPSSLLTRSLPCLSSSYQYPRYRSYTALSICSFFVECSL